MWRAALWIVGLMAVGGLLASLVGFRPGWGVALSLAISAAWIMVRTTVVRVAHSAFRAGKHARASWLYRLLGWMLLSRQPRLATRVSRSACRIGLGEYGKALVALGEVDPEVLDEAARAAWLNNRAYALGRLGEDLQEALDAASRAVSMRPGLPGFRHTRGMVLVGLRRFEDAVRDLDEVWKQAEGDASAQLESERCYDLGIAWQGLGEDDYALDYFDRARRAQPDGRWARLAVREMGARAPRAPSVAELAG